MNKNNYTEEENYRNKKHNKKEHKTPKKSKHKHIYEDCIFENINLNSKTTHVNGERCSICGKEKYDYLTFIPTNKYEAGTTYRVITNEELLIIFPNLPIYYTFLE